MRNKRSPVASSAIESSSRHISIPTLTIDESFKKAFQADLLSQRFDDFTLYSPLILYLH